MRKLAQPRKPIQILLSDDERQALEAAAAAARLPLGTWIRVTCLTTADTKAQAVTPAGAPHGQDHLDRVD